MRKKITIIGAGHVGATTAQLIAEKDMADVVLLDVAEGIAKGKALDIFEACPLWGSSATVRGTASFEDTRDSSIIVITAGLARKPGMSRDDLLEANAKIVHSVAVQIKDLSPEAILVVVTNPMDVMAYLTYKTTQFPSHRVIGMGGVLDTTRFSTFVAEALNVPSDSIKALVLGGHGDSMVPLPSFTSVSGIPLTSLIPSERLEDLIERTRKGGAEIVEMLKTGSAFYAPGASTVEIIDSIMKDKKKILPCSVLLQGEYGIDGIFTGVPIKVSSKGVEEIIELKLTEKELRDLRSSAQAVKEVVKQLNIE